MLTYQLHEAQSNVTTVSRPTVATHRYDVEVLDLFHCLDVEKRVCAGGTNISEKYHLHGSDVGGMVGDDLFISPGSDDTRWPFPCMA